MPGFWTIVGPSLVVFLVLGTVICWGSLLAVRWMKGYASALLAVEKRLQADLESRTKVLAPKRLEELESFCNTLREEFGKLVQLNEEWKSTAYRQTQRYATMINKKLVKFDGVVEKPPEVEEDVILDAELQAADVGGPVVSALSPQEETVETVRAAFFAARRSS